MTDQRTHRRWTHADRVAVLAEVKVGGTKPSLAHELHYQQHKLAELVLDARAERDQAMDSCSSQADEIAALRAELDKL